MDTLNQEGRRSNGAAHGIGTGRVRANSVFSRRASGGSEEFGEGARSQGRR